MTTAPTRRKQPATIATEHLSYVTNDGPVGSIPSRTPEDVARDARVVAESDAQADLTALQTRTEARHLGMSEQAYRLLLKHATPRELADLARSPGVGKAMPSFAQVDAEDLAAGNLDPKQDWRQIAAGLLDEDDVKLWAIMWNPPDADGFVPTFSKVKRLDVAAMTVAGYSMVPNGPLRPAPAVKCDIPYEGGAPCPYKGYTAQEVEKHQQFKHKEGYVARQNRAERTERQQLIALQRQALTVAQDGGPDHLDAIAALQAQIAELKALIPSREPAATDAA